MQTNSVTDIARLYSTRTPTPAPRVPHTYQQERPDRPTGATPSTFGRPRVQSIPKTTPPPLNLPGAGVAAGPPSVPDGAGVEQGNKDPLQALLADWGKSDSPHDLDGDGTVGIKDMLMLLARMANGEPDPPAGDPFQDVPGDGTVTQDPAPPVGDPATDTDEGQAPADPLQALLADWGKTGSPHDLNGDGTVGINDLLMLLEKMAEAKEPGEPGGPRTRLEALLQDWGKSDSMYDLDGDGTVGIKDMLALLARMTRQDGEEATTDESGGPVVHRQPFGHLVRQMRGAYDRAAADNVARSLMPHIAGRTPSELRQSIFESRIPGGQKQLVLDRLAAWYPHGHSLSLVG